MTSGNLCRTSVDKNIQKKTYIIILRPAFTPTPTKNPHKNQAPRAQHFYDPYLAQQGGTRYGGEKCPSTDERLLIRALGLVVQTLNSSG